MASDTGFGPEGFEIKDSGQRQEFDGGGMRDTEEGKVDFSNLFVWFEPMGSRYAEHMTKGRTKYPDPEPGVPNWSLFPATPEMLARTERSLDRHYKAYRAGKTDEDHAAAILFNLNLAEKIRGQLQQVVTADYGSITISGDPLRERQVQAAIADHIKRTRAMYEEALFAPATCPILGCWGDALSSTGFCGRHTPPITGGLKT